MSTVLDRNGRPMRLVAATNTTPVADAGTKRLRVCNHGNDVVGIAEYMVAEMQRNPFTEQGRKMTEANAYDIGKEMAAWQALPWYAKFGGPPPTMPASPWAGRRLPTASGPSGWDPDGLGITSLSWPSA